LIPDNCPGSCFFFHSLFFYGLFLNAFFPIKKNTP
jgi:hypothetical protein